MKADSLVYFFLALNAAAYIIGVLAASGTIMPINSGGAAPYDQTAVNNQFSLTNFSSSAVTAGVVGAGIIGVIGWITKQNVYALFAMSIWLVGIFLNIFSFILQGLSALVTTLLPPDVAFMGGVIYGFVLICFFYALARTVGQNPSLGR